MDDAVIEARRAHDALLRSRSQLLAQRDALNTRITRIESAIDVLGELFGSTPEAVAPPEPAAPPEPTPEPPPGQAVQAAQPANRKARIREVMLESPEEWLTAAEMASRIEGQFPSEPRRIATYEMMRRMTKQGELELDNSSKPTKFRARPATIRERLLAARP